MAQYVLLMKLHTKGLKSIHDDPELLLRLNDGVERWDSKVLATYQLLGEWDICMLIDAPDNFHAYRAVLSQELGTTADTEILPAIDLPIFQRLMSQTTETGGPHQWQIKWWAKIARLSMRWYAYSRHVWKNCKPLTVTGKHHFKSVDGPCVIVSNHASHMDTMVLMHSLPQRVKWNLYFGAAADRWFLKGRKETTLQPWYQSMVMSLFPIQRGGGSASLDHGKWLVDQGGSLMIFPEGTRSKTKSLSKFRHGVALLALEKGIPVVPIYMTGLAAMRPKGQKTITPGPAGAHILPAIHFDKDTPVPDATRQIYRAMNDAHMYAMTHGNDALAKKLAGIHSRTELAT